ncbi:hypothetical protein HGRIS_014972 [Hohenbuehelia grisea]|uniref:Secreted protein n=1 Tax=Hohenbuehelia grisea TaxID=104357 RepID=A0ABR3IRD3_9AGAR
MSVRSFCWLPSSTLFSHTSAHSVIDWPRRHFALGSALGGSMLVISSMSLLTKSREMLTLWSCPFVLPFKLPFIVHQKVIPNGHGGRRLMDTSPEKIIWRFVTRKSLNAHSTLRPFRTVVSGSERQPYHFIAMPRRAIQSHSGFQYL